MFSFWWSVCVCGATQHLLLVPHILLLSNESSFESKCERTKIANQTNQSCENRHYYDY